MTPVVARCSRYAVSTLSWILTRRYLSSMHVRAPWPRTHRRGSCLVFANHQSAIDVPAAAEITRRLGFTFATWAHADFVRHAPFIRRLGFLETSSRPQAFARLIDESRRLLRQPGLPTMLWIFPEGRFTHPAAAITPYRGALLAACACPDVDAFVCGFDYSIFRRFRPHSTAVFSGPIDAAAMSTDDLSAVMDNNTSRRRPVSGLGRDSRWPGGGAHAVAIGRTRSWRPRQRQPTSSSRLRRRQATHLLATHRLIRVASITSSERPVHR